MSTEPQQLLPANLQRHYCRQCGETFDRSEANLSTPHAQTWIHLRRQHGTDMLDYQSCSRYCEHREQPEERAAGKRMYGLGLPHATSLDVLRSYENLGLEE